MSIIESTLHYLREALANYNDNEITQQIARKLETNQFESDEEFVKSLDENEIVYLNSLLAKEVDYAQGAQDDVRARQLNEIYEQLL